MHKDELFGDDPMLTFMLSSIVTNSKIEGFSQLLPKQAVDKYLVELSQYLLNDINGLQYILNEFNYDRCIDFLQMCPDDHLT